MAYEMRISDWSSDVCSSDLPPQFASDRVSFFATSKAGFVYKFACRTVPQEASQVFVTNPALKVRDAEEWEREAGPDDAAIRLIEAMAGDAVLPGFVGRTELGLPRKTDTIRSEEHTSELQSLMRISY